MKEYKNIHIKNTVYYIFKMIKKYQKCILKHEVTLSLTANM